MADRQPLDQRQTPLPSSPRVDSVDGSFPAVLGRSSERGGDQRTLVSGGSQAPHRSVGAPGYLLLSIKGRLVQVLTDNTTAMWYCNKQGKLGPWVLC